jgi:hypothetical protein
VRHVAIRFATLVDPAAFAKLDGVRVEHVKDGTVRLSAPEPAMDGIVKTAAQYPVVDLISEPADLEEIFLELYRESS